MMSQKKNEPRKIIIHCSATPDFGDSIGAKEIRRWHIEENGWQDIGYHYVIRRSGKVEIGRPEDQVGSHTKGYNQDSIGICLVGTKKFSQMQYDALSTLVDTIMHRHKIRFDEIYGHYEFNESKECPGVDMTLMRCFLAEKLRIIKV